MHYVFLGTFLATAACLYAESPADQAAKPAAFSAEPLADEIAAHLQKLKSLVEQDSPDDDAIRKELERLNKAISDEQLPAVEKYAALPEAKTIAWPLAWLFVERGRFDSAAELMVNQLSEVKENRAYRLWKWWEYSFGKRDDYQRLNKEITEALLKQFDKGPEARKLVIVELFGKNAKDAKLSLEEFRATLPKPKQP